MTETLARPDVDEHQLKDLDFDIVCAVRDCTRAADWWNVCLECGWHTPACDPHRREHIRDAETADRRTLVLCPECHHATLAAAWRQLFAFVPIGRT